MIASACGKKTTRHRAHRRAGRRLNGRATSLCSEYGKRAHQASRQSSIKCRWNESPNADDPRHFTLIRQENCDSKKPGQRPSMFCDSAILSRRDACRAANGLVSILSLSDQVCSAQQTRGRHASRHDRTTSHPARRLSSTTTLAWLPRASIHFKNP